jgi:pilus assembly protein Flp/PilA
MTERLMLKDLRLYIQVIKTLRDDERGASAIEYGLIAAAIAVAIAGTVTDVGTRVGQIFTNLRNALPAVTGGTT